MTIHCTAFAESGLTPHVAAALQDALAEAGPDPVLPTALLERCGLSATHIRTLIRRGVLVRLHHGWYAPREVAAAPWDRHRLQATARLREADGALVASHHTALLLAGLPTWGAPPGTVHLMRANGGRHHVGPGVVIHQQDAATRRLAALVADDEGADARDPGSSDGGGPPGHTASGLATALAVVQTGLLNGVLDLLVAGDCALHRKLLTRADLEVALEAHGRNAGVGRVRNELDLLDGRAESPYESVLRWALRTLGHDVRPQAEVTTAAGAHRRLDIALGDPASGHGLAIEVDGAVKYRVDPDGVHAAQDAREEELAALGWDVIRFRTDQIADGSTVRWDHLRRRMDARLARAAA